MKDILGIYFLCVAFWAYGQDPPVQLQLYHKASEDGQVDIYADNDEHYPISIAVQPKAINMDVDPTFPGIVVIPAQSRSHQIARLLGRHGKSWKFSYTFTYFPGDVITASHDDTYVYELPYRDNHTFMLSQGYQGRLSHQGENALDFDMPEGTIILAARGGTVVEVVVHNDRSCPDESCNDFNNFIRILHEDGSFSEYAHLQKDGALVAIGDHIEAGDQIALSGNTGWTTGPHLHFVAFLPIEGGRKTLQTKFSLRDGTVTKLIEGNFY